MNIDAKAREIAEKHGLRCLIPVGKSGFTCHEHTLCDCKVIELLSAIRNEALEEAAQMTTHPKLKSGLYGSQDFMFGWDGAAYNIATAIRALKDTTAS
jgi:hypothetical protein